LVSISGDTAVKLQQPSYLTPQLLPYRQSRVLRSSTSDLLSTQSSSTNIAARQFSCYTPTVGTVFLHLYALLIVSLVLGLSSRLTCLQDVCSQSTVRAPNTHAKSFVRYKFVIYSHVLRNSIPGKDNSTASSARNSDGL